LLPYAQRELPERVASRGIKAPAFRQRDQVTVDASELVMAS